MRTKIFPVIDIRATGRNIKRLREARGLSVRDVQAFLGFDSPQAIYHWQEGKALPTVDNLFALSVLLDEPLEKILVRARYALKISEAERMFDEGCSMIFYRLFCYEAVMAFVPIRLAFPVELGYL